jgi:two-component system response regulator ChvI
MTAKIALIDDDQNILASVAMALEAEGYTVICYHDGGEALEGLRADWPDLAVIDIKMPRMDGMSLLQQLRTEGDLPAIFLTSKNDEVDEELGLRMGADDYVTKPFSQRLLIARIDAILRRNQALQQPATDAQILRRGHLMMDEARHRCTWRGHDINLTVTEFILLYALAARPGHVKTRDQLIDLAYGEDIFIEDRAIDTHIKRVRKKFREIDPGFDHIETLYGAGYKYRED